MRKIIFATHHKLADGMKDTINYIMPNSAEIETISAYVTNSPIQEDVEKVLQNIEKDDEVIVFTDLLGGSVNQAFVKYLENENIHVITGMNVPVIMAILLSLTNEKITTNQINFAIKEAQEQIVYVNDFISKQSLDEDDE